MWCSSSVRRHARGRARRARSSRRPARRRRRASVHAPLALAPSGPTLPARARKTEPPRQGRLFSAPCASESRGRIDQRHQRDVRAAGLLDPYAGAIVRRVGAVASTRFPHLHRARLLRVFSRARGSGVWFTRKSRRFAPSVSPTLPSESRPSTRATLALRKTATRPPERAWTAARARRRVWLLSWSWHRASERGGS